MRNREDVKDLQPLDMGASETRGGKDAVHPHQVRAMRWLGRHRLFYASRLGTDRHCEIVGLPPHSIDDSHCGVVLLIAGGMAFGYHAGVAGQVSSSGAVSW